MSGVYLAEKLNRFLGAQWQSFATQNYFDPHGIFISILWSGPLLVIAMLILVSILNLFSFFAIKCTNPLNNRLNTSPTTGKYPLLFVPSDCSLEKGRAQTPCQTSEEGELSLFTDSIVVNSQSLFF